MTTLNTFNRHIDTPEVYDSDYHFYLVDFKDIHSGKRYFRIIDASVNFNHKERLAYFDADINGRGEHYEHRYDVVAYEIDMEPGEMLEAGLTSHVFHETYWDRAIQGAL